MIVGNIFATFRGFSFAYKENCYPVEKLDWGLRRNKIRFRLPFREMVFRAYISGTLKNVFRDAILQIFIFRDFSTWINVVFHPARLCTRYCNAASCVVSMSPRTRGEDPIDAWRTSYLNTTDEDENQTKQSVLFHSASAV